MERKCPKCKEKIDTLKCYEEQYYFLSKEKIGILESAKGYVDDSFNAECPNCNEVIFENYEEAKKFLRGD